MVDKKRIVINIILDLPWLDFIQVALALLKLNGVINWSWWIILIPLWLFMVVWVLTAIIGITIGVKKIKQNLQADVHEEPKAPGVVDKTAGMTEEEKAQLPEGLRDFMENFDMSKMQEVPPEAFELPAEITEEGGEIEDAEQE